MRFGLPPGSPGSLQVMKVSMPPEDAGFEGRYASSNVEVNWELAYVAAAAASPVLRISSPARLTVGPLVSHLRGSQD
jgi:hypothetical protein